MNSFYIGVMNVWRWVPFKVTRKSGFMIGAGCLTFTFIKGVDAQAKVAAAAPAMLNALEWIVNNTSADSVHHGVAAAAIAKTKGDSQ